MGAAVAAGRLRTDSMAAQTAKAIDLPDGVTIVLTRVIGRGGSGVVHEAVLRERGGERTVAVKMLGRGSTDKQQRAFLKEIQKAMIIGSRCHGVVKTYGSLLHDGQCCLIMKLYQDSLAQRLDLGGKLSLREALRYIIQIARALKSVHAEGAAVLDLKPANLLFDEDGFLNIADFGISLVSDLTMTNHTTNNGGGKGTPIYSAFCRLSINTVTAAACVCVVSAGPVVTNLTFVSVISAVGPELHDPDEYGKPTAKADVWALACVFLEMLTGEPVWKGVSARFVPPPAARLKRWHVGRVSTGGHHLFDCVVSPPAGATCLCSSAAQHGLSRTALAVITSNCDAADKFGARWR